jgi:hypothetical protein
MRNVGGMANTRSVQHRDSPSHPMKNSLVGIRARQDSGISAAIALLTFPRIILCTTLVATFNKIDALLLRPLKVTSVCPECENAEFRNSYKQYIMYSFPQIKNDCLEHNTCNKPMEFIFRYS